MNNNELIQTIKLAITDIDEAFTSDDAIITFRARARVRNRLSSLLSLLEAQKTMEQYKWRIHKNKH